MRHSTLGFALLASTFVIASHAHATPIKNDDEGFYLEPLTDDVGLAAGSTNAVVDPDGGWVELVSQLGAGTFTTKDIDPTAVQAWGKVYIKGSGALSVQVRSGGSNVGTQTLIASDDPLFTRMAVLGIPASTTPIQVRVTFSASGPSEPIVDALKLTWTPKSKLKLQASGPATLCSGATGLWRFPMSVSNVTSRATVVTVELETGALSPSFSQANRLQFVSATNGGQYHAGPGTIVIDGVPVEPNHVYWRLGDVRFGSTFPLAVTAVIPNGTIGGTTYQLTADAHAANADDVSATTALTTANATPDLVVEKTLTGVYRIGDQWHAKTGSTVGYTLTVRNRFAPTCRATAERVVVWDPLQITTSGGSYPYASTPTSLTGLTHHTGAPLTLHGGDPAGNLITVPSNAVYAQIPALAPGASATFEVRLPLAAALPFGDHVVNVAHVDSGYLPQADPSTASADFYIGIDYTPFGNYSKGDWIRGSGASSALEDNPSLSVGYDEYFKFLLSVRNGGASVLRDTTAFDKLPVALVELVDVYVPPGSGATIWYYPASGADSGNLPTDPPGYDPLTGDLSGLWTQTPTADALWVAVKVPRIGSRVITDTNGASPLEVTAEIAVRTRVPVDPSAACDEATIANVAWFHTVGYENELGTYSATGHAGTSNGENVRIVPKVPSFGTSYLHVPGTVVTSGPLRFDLTVVNRLASNPAQTDTAEGAVVRVIMPAMTNPSGGRIPLDLLGVTAPGATIDYNNLPDYFEIRWTSIPPNTTIDVAIDTFVPKGGLINSQATMMATIDALDVGNQCPVEREFLNATTLFEMAPFLQLDKRIDFAVAGRDTDVAYTLRAFNTGEGGAEETVIFDKLPTELEFVGAPVDDAAPIFWFSEADVPDLPADVRADGDYTSWFVRHSGLFEPGIDIGGYVMSPFPNPTWIAVLADDRSQIPPHLPPDGVAREFELQMHVPADAEPDSVIVNEANISGLFLLPAVSNRPQLLVSDDPALRIDGECPDAIASGENIILAEVFQNNSTNPDTTAIARMIIPTDLVTATQVTISSAAGSHVIPLPAGDASHFVSYTDNGTTATIVWDITSELGRPLAPGEAVNMDLEIEALTLTTGTPIPIGINGTATRVFPDSSEVTVNVGAQCTTLVANPDLKVTKLVDSGSAVSGDVLNYTLVIENNGPHAVTNAIVREALPAGLTIVPGTVRISPAPWTFGGNSDPSLVAGTDPANGGAIYEWSRDEGNAIKMGAAEAGYVPGNSTNIYIRFQVDVGPVTAGTDLVNCARSELGTELDGDELADPTADNLSCVTTHVPNPDPRITKTGPLTVLPGQTYAYTLSWSNASRQAATNVVFYERVPNFDAPGDADPDLIVTSVFAPPGGEVFYAATPLASTDPLAHPTFSFGAPATGDWKATVAELAGAPATWIAFKVGALPGNSAVANATVNVIATDPDPGDGGDTAGGTNIINCAHIEMNGVATADEVPGNNLSCLTTQVPGLNVAIQKICDPEGFYPGARPGDGTSFTLVMSNLGTSPSYGIRVVDPMPAWFTFGEYDPSVATLVDQNGGPISFVDEDGDAIAGGVAWTRVGASWYLGSDVPTDPRYYRNVGLPSGARTTLAISGLVSYDVAAETLATNDATIFTDRKQDADPAELAAVLFDNADSCSLVVHRPDPMVEKRAEILGDAAGAGEQIDWRIGYDNLGLADADDVVLEDLLPEGVAFVVGSLTDVPEAATVSYFDGTSWGYTPVGAEGAIDPNVKGFRVSFTSFPAPVGGGFRQDSRASFERGTFAGTIWDPAAQAIVVDPGYSGSSPTYTSPVIPTPAGTIVEWIGYVAEAAAGIPGTPQIEILGGPDEDELISLDPGELSADLSDIDPLDYQSIILRAHFTPPFAPDYGGGFASVPGLGGSPMVGAAYKNSGDYIAGLASRDGNGAQQAVLWQRLGGIFEMVDLGADVGAEQIVYLDGNYLVTSGDSVRAWRRESDDTWTGQLLGTPSQGAQAARLDGDNHGLCTGGGPERPCIFVAFSDASQGDYRVHYDGPSGWVEVIVPHPNTYQDIGSINSLGYFSIGPTFNGPQEVVRPTGTGWEGVQMPTIPSLSFYNRGILSSDSADLLIAAVRTASPFYAVYHLFPSVADPAIWEFQHVTGSPSSNAQIITNGPEGTYAGYLGSNRIWRRDGATFPSYPIAATLSVNRLGLGVAGGTVQSSGTRPRFAEFNGTDYVEIDPVSAFGPFTGDLLGFDASGTRAFGNRYDDFSVKIGYLQTPGGVPHTWEANQLVGTFESEVRDLWGAGELGWVGSVDGPSFPTTPAVWEEDQITDPAAVDPTILETPLASFGDLLGATPEGCMIGQVGAGGGYDLTQWIKQPDGTYLPELFSDWDVYNNIAFVVATPEHRLFGNAVNGLGNDVAVEFVCGADGLELVELPRGPGQGASLLARYERGLLVNELTSSPIGWWLVEGATGVEFLNGNEGGDAEYITAFAHDGVIFGAHFGTGFDLPFAAYDAPAGGDDFTFQMLDMPPDAEQGAVYDFDGSRRLLGYALVDGIYHVVIWTRASPMAPWTLTGDLPGYLPSVFVGSGGRADILARDENFESFIIDTDGGLDPVYFQDLDFSFYQNQVLSPPMRAALENNVILTFEPSTGSLALIALSPGGTWETTYFSEDDGYYQWVFLGQVQPGVFLALDFDNVYTLRVGEDGSMEETAIDLDGLGTQAWSFDQFDLGDVAPDGTFMMWLEDSGGGEEEGGGLTSVAFIPDPDSAGGYRIHNLGLSGTLATSPDGYPGFDVTPGQYLGNGCWTALEQTFDDGSLSFENGIDTVGGTNGLRLWGCPVAAEPEALASWAVSYRGDVSPEIGVSTVVQKVCQATIANTATISTSTPQVSAANDSSTATVPVENADVSVELTSPASVIDAAADPDLTLTVTITNNGPSAANDVAVALDLPPGLQLGAGGQTQWAFATLAAGDVQTFEVPVTFTSTAADVTYHLGLASTASSIDCDPDNESVALQLLTGEHPNIAVIKSGPASVRVFEAFDWNVSWENLGNLDSGAFTVTDTVPGGVTVLDPGAFDDSGPALTYEEDGLPVGDGANDTISAVVNDCSLIGQSLTNTIAAPYTGDADPSDNEAAASTVVLGPRAALELGVVTSRATVDLNGALHVTAYFRSSGIAPVEGAVVAIGIPTGFTVAFDSLPPGASVLPPPFTGNGVFLGTSHVRIPLGQLAIDAVGSVTFVVRGSTSGSATFDAVASGTNACGVSASVGVTVAPDTIHIAKSASRDNACPGDEVTWSIVVSNPGATAVGGLAVFDLVTNGTSYVAGSITGPGADDSGDPALSWNIGSLAAGASATLTYTTTITSTDPLLTSTAPSWSSSNDSGFGNQTAVRVACDNPLSLIKEVAIGCVNDVTTIDVTLRYANNGTTDAEDVVISDYVGHLPIIGATPTPSDGDVRFFVDIPAGGSGVVTYSATLSIAPADAGDLLANRAVLNSSGVAPLQTSNQVVVAAIVCAEVGCQSDGECDDGNYCNGVETCSGGTCQPGTNPCPGAICNETFDRCDVCDSNDDCDDGTFCDGAEECVNGQCQEGNDPCPNDPFCDEAAEQCTECETNGDCADGTFCNGGETCEGGFCQPGFDPCEVDEVCNEVDDTCDECDEDGDCDDGDFCNGEEQCTGGSCEPGVTTCELDEFCNETNDTCDECVTDAHCDDGLFCNGGEQCIAGSCDPGSSACDIDEICNELLDRCEECDEDLDCDDGAFCNGAEVCTGGFCEPGVVTCELDEFCNGTTDTCDECETDAHCDDTLFCNGEELCSGGLCGPGLTSCLGTEYCNETTDTCDECQTDEHCDDGAFCNGEEQCAAGSCTSGTVPCTAIEICNETDDRCDECDDNGDCADALFCNGDEVCEGGVCGPGTAPCPITQTCIEESDVCGECALDVHCDDGEFCNGQEACENGTCVDGTDPCAAPLECDEPTDACVNCNDSSDCDDQDQCTEDACQDGTCQYDPVEPRAIDCGTGSCGGVVTGTETCLDDVWTDDCDELPQGQIPDTSCNPLRVAYAIVNDANGEPYGTIRCFQVIATGVIDCETVLGSETELKVYDAFFCGIQE